METQKIRISNEAAAWRHLEHALLGQYDNKVINLDFSDWPKFRVNIKGDRYKSTVTTALMKSLIELQININNIYGEIIYGRDSRSLSDSEREAIQLVFRVEEGSTDLVADISGFFTELGRKAGEKLTGNQIIITVLGVAAIWAGTSSFDNYIQSNQASKEDARKHEITMALINKVPALAKIEEDQIETNTKIIKSVSDADSVELGATKFSKKDIAEITFQDKRISEYQRLDGKYHVSSLKKTPSHFKIEVTHSVSGETIKTQVDRGLLNIDEMDKLTKAFSTEKLVHLNIAARFNGEGYTRAIILGVDNKANGEKIESVAKR